jgi:hypothetical protein
MTFKALLAPVAGRFQEELGSSGALTCVGVKPDTQNEVSPRNLNKMALSMVLTVYLTPQKMGQNKCSRAERKPSFNSSQERAYLGEPERIRLNPWPKTINTISTMKRYLLNTMVAL